MSKLKDKINASEEWKEYSLTDQELVYIQFVNRVAEQTIAGFLTYVATTRLGYPGDKTLQYDMNFTDPKVKVRVAPEPVVEP